MPLIFKFTLVLFFLTGCAHESERLPKNFEPRSAFFYSSFEQVWRATQIAISAYPLKVNNMEKGLLVTTKIDDNSIFQNAHIKKGPKTAIKYNLRIQLVKGSVNGKKSVKVIIKKKKAHTANFFSGAKELPTDGVEEKAILYEIKRELQVERILERSADKG